CDQETAFAFETAGGKPEVVHLNRLLESPRLAEGFQILAIPGGFSYGDDLSAGRIFGNQMRHHLRGCLEEFKAAGKLIIGICNGFQILIKSGVLLPDRADEPIATLTLNEGGRFEDRWIHLQVASDKCVFLRGIERMYLPIAHAEGKFVARDEATLERLQAAGQLVLRYCMAEGTGDRGQETEDRGQKTEHHSPLSIHHSPLTTIRNPQLLPFPHNPNGAQVNVAGLCDETGRVFGLMPHPERHIDPTQHPRWTREQRERGDGLAVFENAVRFFA
ncbi:MAG TPA: phosphoribosylformylglycinamidine synthase subunit PurQ, partial [Pirellulaceae bacterium]|nr:phosphoribosylformylglycinamidine synthase subunit PurQ [Pirellulaceae bacterium]